MMAIGCWFIVSTYFHSWFSVRVLLLAGTIAIWGYLGSLYFRASIWSAVLWSAVLGLFCCMSLYRMIRWEGL